MASEIFFDCILYFMEYFGKSTSGLEGTQGTFYCSGSQTVGLRMDSGCQMAQLQGTNIRKCTGMSLHRGTRRILLGNIFPISNYLITSEDKQLRGSVPHFVPTLLLRFKMRTCEKWTEEVWNLLLTSETIPRAARYSVAKRWGRNVMVEVESTVSRLQSSSI